MSTKKIDLKLLTKLIEEREKSLQEKPHLLKVQKEIDTILEKIGDDPDKRMTVLNELMMKKLKEELVPALLDLSSTINNFKDAVTSNESTAVDNSNKSESKEALPDNVLHI
ncbi:MAG: hypothetical protein HQK51_01700 [Oligoflexia bacterium]|nr:hypothetical protein [Oligoflexia bacterium]